jgi:FixJ family two-component response regulator
VVRPKVWFVESGCCVDSVVTGNPSRQSPMALGIIIETVETHHARMMMKVGTDSIADLLQLATSLKPFNRSRG